MASVGERLKVEREARTMTIDEMAAATGIGRSYLEALERDEIRELPGKAFGKLYIRAYAEVLSFDPQPWIDDYDREQRLAQGASTEPTPKAPVGSRPVAAAIARWKESRVAPEKAEPAIEAVEAVEAVATEQETPPEEPEAPIAVSPKPGRPIAPLVLLGVVAIAAAIYFGLRGTGGDKSVVRRPVEPAPESRPPEPPPPVVAEPRPSPPPKPPPAKPIVRTAPAGSLTVPEFGVGRRIVNLHLEGEGDRFAPGDRVCFSSRVLGGRRGEVIRHVWIYEGRVQQTITLPLGGSDWRTHSNKTIGHAGRWAVEARDTEGRVLARAELTCAPGGPL